MGGKARLMPAPAVSGSEPSCRSGRASELCCSTENIPGLFPKRDLSAPALGTGMLTDMRHSGVDEQTDQQAALQGQTDQGRASTRPGCSRKTFPCEGSWQGVGSAGDGWGSSIIWGLGLTLKPHSSSPSLLQVPRCSYPCQVRAQRVPKGCAGASEGSQALGSAASHWEKK